MNNDNILSEFQIFKNKKIKACEYIDVNNHSLLQSTKVVNHNNIVRDILKNINKCKHVWCEKIPDGEFKVFLDIRNINNKDFNTVYSIVSDFIEFCKSSKIHKFVNIEEDNNIFGDYEILYNKKLRGFAGESFIIVFYNTIVPNVDTYKKTLSDFLESHEHYKKYIVYENYNIDSDLRLPYYPNMLEENLIPAYYEEDVYILASGKFDYINDKKFYIIKQHHGNRINITALKKCMITLIPSKHVLIE